VDISQYNPETVHALSSVARGDCPIAPDGSYKLGGLDAGDYTLLAVARHTNSTDFYVGARFATTYVTLGQDETIQHDFDLR